MKIERSGDRIENYFEECQLTLIQNFGNNVYFYQPSFSSKFPSISVTGKQCALKCKHCSGLLLNSMVPATTPDKLFGALHNIKESGGIGCLISGGCTGSGSVPLDEFIPVIKQFSKELEIVVHTGLVDEATARALKNAGVRSVLIDVIGSDETIKEIYHLNAKVSDYEESLKNVKKAGLELVPHVLAGLHYGKLLGEFNALKIISRYEPAAVIILGLRPIQNTPFENVTPPSPKDIASVLCMARLMMLRVPLVLGCVRPLGEHKQTTEELALECGVNAIVNPSGSTINLARGKGRTIHVLEKCCASIYSDIKVL